MVANTGIGRLAGRARKHSVSHRACVTVAMALAVMASPLQLGNGAAAAQTAPSGPASTPSSFPPVDPSAPTSKPPPEVEVPIPDVASVGKPSVPPAPKPGEELLDRRTVNSKTFTTDKPGELRTELYEAPVHFKDPQGRWTAIDDTLGTSKDGRRRNTANVFDLSLADSSTDKAVARLAVDDKHSVGFALDGAAEVKAKGDKHSVTYFKVRKDTDMRLTSRRGGVKDELVLASPAAPDRFVFPLELKGLTASLDEAGNVIYRDEAGVERARTPHGFMTDANIDPRSGEAPMSLGVTYALIPWKGGTALEVRLDRAWLDDPARQYPVTVDPEIHNAAWGDDTYVMSGFYRDNSYDAELKVGTYDGGAHIGRAFMHFDSGAITNTTVTHAELHLAERHSWNCNYQPEPVWRVVAGWNGRGIPDWSQQPPTDANAIAGGTFANAGCSNRLAVWNVTSAAATWAANPGANFGLSLRATNEYDNNRWKKYASTEAGAPPALHVWYNRPPAVPYNVTPVNGSVFGTPSTPVSAVYSDPDGNSGYLAFGVWNYQNQLVWSQWSGLLCSGCGTTLAVPALPDNWYYVMVIGHDGAQYSSAWSPQQWYFIDTLPPAASELRPLNGASGSSPAQVSARYSEPYGFTGYMYFWLYTTGGTRIVENWSAITNPGAVASLAIPNLAPGTYNLWAMPWDTRQTGPQIGPNTFTVGSPATTTTVPATTTTTVAPRSPDAPAKPYAEAQALQATVTWAAPADNGSLITRYIVRADPEPSITIVDGVDGNPPATSAQVQNLEDGTTYRFTVTAHNGKGASAPSEASEPVTPPGGAGVFALVGMGDSYAAGEGVPYDPATDTPENRCHRSSDAYSTSAADALGLSVRNVACGGARISNLVGTSGQFNEPAQIEQLTGKERYISVTIGGNDAGFGEVLDRCVDVPVFHPNEPCAPELDETVTTRISNLRAPLAAAFNQIQARAPFADIVVLGYPRLFAPEGSFGDTCNHIRAADVSWLNDRSAQLDGVISAAAGDAQVRFRSVAAAFSGHELCSGDEWLHGIVLEPGANTDNNFHPTLNGHLAMRNQLVDAMFE